MVRQAESKTLGRERPKSGQRRCLLVVLCLLGWVSSGPCATSAGGSSLRLGIVDRSIELHGGPRLAHSQVSFVITSLSGAYRVETMRDGSLFDFRVTRQREGVTTVYRHASDAVEKWVDGKKVDLDEAGKESVKKTVAARVYFSFLPMNLNDGNTFKEDQGLERWDGRQLHRVKVTFREDSSNGADDAYLFWFDPETARLEQFAYSFNGGLRFRTLDNYRVIDGLTFFDQENYAIDASGLTVDLIRPRYVDEQMKHLSTVRFTDIVVQPLEPAAETRGE